MQAMDPKTFCIQHGQWTAAFHDDVAALASFGTANRESISQLLLGFFDYWHRQHDWKNGVVCVRTGGVVHKATKGWDRRVWGC